MKKPLLLLLILPTIFPTTAFANILHHQANTISNNQTILLSQAAFNYQFYNNILGKYVSDRGLVNYQELQQNRQELDKFNQSFSQVTNQTYNSWDKAEKIAFLLNAYNSFTLQSIIDQSPLKKSIRDIPGVWKRRNLRSQDYKKL